jgi:hypothetical protein
LTIYERWITGFIRHKYRAFVYNNRRIDFTSSYDEAHSMNSPCHPKIEISIARTNTGQPNTGQPGQRRSRPCSGTRIMRGGIGIHADPVSLMPTGPWSC